jgi:hypothetical protein
MLRKLTLCVAAITCRCGVVATVNARNDMERSKTDYKQCLRRHPDIVSAYEGLRLAHEVDFSAYRATSAGILPGAKNTVYINSETVPH